MAVITLCYSHYKVYSTSMEQAWQKHGKGNACVWNLCLANQDSTFYVALISINMQMLHKIWKTCFHNLTFAYNVEDSKPALGLALLVHSTTF